MKKKTLFGLMIFLFIDLCANAQSMGNDRNGKDVFNFYQSSQISFPITTANSTAKINYSSPFHSIQNWVARTADTIVSDHKLDTLNHNFFCYDSSNTNTNTKRYYYRYWDTFAIKLDSNGHYQDSSILNCFSYATSHNDSARLTIAKSWSYNFSGSAGNLLHSISSISALHPTWALSVGIGKTIDVFNNWNNIRSLKNPFVFTYNLSYNLNWDNVLIYDTIANKTLPRSHPFTHGLEFEWTAFYHKPVLHKWIIAFSNSTTFEFDNNLSDLKNFQANNPYYANSSVISLGDVVGKVGSVIHKNSIRERISLPIFPTAFKVHVLKDKKDSVQLCLIPYYETFGSVNTQLNQIVGFFINVNKLNQSLYSHNSTVSPGWGFGIDWEKNDGEKGFSNMNFFVAGSLDIASLFTHTPRAISGQ